MIALAVTLVAIAGSASADEDYVIWDITDYQQRSGITVNVVGNLTVRAGGHLDLTNVDLRVGSTEGYGTEGIFVFVGGKLTMNGGTIAPLYNNPMTIQLHDESTLEGVHVRGIAGWGIEFDSTTGALPPLTGYMGGIQVFSDDVYIGNCTIELNDVCGIYVKDSSPTIYGNTIRDIYYKWYEYLDSVNNTTVSAQAYGIILDASPAVIESNEIYNIGNWTELADNPHGDGSGSYDIYLDLIAVGIATKSMYIEMDSNEVYDIGSILNNPNIYNLSGPDYTQYYTQYMVAGLYGYEAVGSNVKLNTFRNSGYGIYIDVSTSTAGGAMAFEIIIDNEILQNALAGVFFDLDSVSRDCTINVSDNDLDANGEGISSGLDDSGLVVQIGDCTGDVTVDLTRNNFRSNIGRGAHVTAFDHSGKLDVLVTARNTFSGNGGAGLLVELDTISGPVKVLIENSSFIQNDPQRNGDSGAITIIGGALSSSLDVKMADTTASSNTGSGVRISMGEGMSVNLATSTKYTFYNCQFGTNSLYGIYLYDNYGANAQRAVYDWQSIYASDNNWAVYVHSNSQLGNIHFRLDGLEANDASTTATAVTIQLKAATFIPKSLLQDITINYVGGSAPSATGMALQGIDENKRWLLDIYRAAITQPGTALDAQFCEISVLHSKLEGVGVNTIIARDSNVRLRYCEVPDLSAQTQGTGVDMGVYYYSWFNVSLIAWQNSEPIVNTTVSIKRFRDPKEEIYTEQTNSEGKLPSKMVPYWEVDSNNNPLRNADLQAFIHIRGDTLNSLWFDFNDTAIGIEDPDVPELIINSPGEGTVQKSGSMVLQGEIRDSHSGIRFVEVTLDNVVWYPVEIPRAKWGSIKYIFTHPISDLTDGVYTITIRGWDVARYPQENLSFQQVTIKDVRIDTQPPALQIVQPPQPYETTNNQTYEIIGQTERSVNIRKLTINDTPVSIFGSTFSLTVRLHEGSNFFIIIAEDMAGNIAVSTREIILDTSPPTLIVSSPSYGDSSNEIEIEVAGDTEQTATVYVKLDDKPPQEVLDRGGTRFYFVLTIKDEGTHTVTVISEDLAGNTFEESILVRYDITPPVMEDIVPTHDPKPTNQQTIQVSGRTDNDVFQVTINDHLKFPVQEGYFAAEINLLEGLQLLTIHVMDMAGNENVTTRSVLIDVTPPLLLDLTVSSTTAGGESWALTDDLVINERSVRFRGRLAEEDIRDLYIQVEADNRSAIMDDPEALTFYRDFNLDEGENLLNFFAIDIAGNRLQLSYILDVDPRAPTLEFYHPKLSGAMETKVDEETVFISGKVDDNSVVTLFINNRQVLVTPNTGAFQTNVPLEPGLNNIPVVVTDKAGNMATDEIHITFEEAGSSGTSVGETLTNLWWVFAIVIGLMILVPITVHTTREKWLKDHPELDNWDSKRAKEGLYEYEEEFGYPEDEDNPGGGN